MASLKNPGVQLKKNQELATKLLDFPVPSFGVSALFPLEDGITPTCTVSVGALISSTRGDMAHRKMAAIEANVGSVVTMLLFEDSDLTAEVPSYCRDPRGQTSTIVDWTVFLYSLLGGLRYFLHSTF